MLRQLGERHPRSVRPRQPQPAGPAQAHPPAPHRQPPAPKPYQLKPKRDQETFIELSVEKKEVPPLNTKQIKHLKKKQGKLNNKIRHSKKKHNNLISKRNSIKKKIEELKGPSKPEEEQNKESFNPVELEQAFDRAYRSYRINGRSRIGVDRDSKMRVLAQTTTFRPLLWRANTVDEKLVFSLFTLSPTICYLLVYMIWPL